MDRWAGKTAVVTGASAGIGAAISVRLADAGMRVVGLARRTDLVEALRSKVQGPGSIHARQCDVTDAAAVADAFAWVEDSFGGVDVVVNNAGVFFQGHITDVGNNQIGDDQWNTVLDLNVKAVIACSRRAISSMKKRGVSGHVINISSLAGHYIPFSELFNVYCATKHAVCAFSAALLNELAHLGSGIKVTSISPGLVDTAMIGEGNPLPKMRPEDVADAVAYVLATPPSVNVNEMVITTVGEKRL
ncbi:farnesol dehydrogenase-like [Ostrinia nubilalis]|uniref:farnesol dehydrogenase-like n=1 Tax=Ostrinia nubilalis TaxID=29057 RepID=UPI003082278C